MQEDINELREMPLEQLLSAPLIALTKAQQQAAITTAQFIEEIGFKRTTDDDSFFDNTENLAKNDYDVRVAKLHIDANGNVVNVDIPFITLFQIPTFEISNFDWSFNVKLKSMQTFSAKFATSTAVTATHTSDFGLNIKNILKLNSSMKVEATTKTDFESRFKSGREQEYNLSINVKGNAAPLPKGPATSKRRESGGAMRALPRPPALPRSSRNSHLNRYSSCPCVRVESTQARTCGRLTGCAPTGSKGPGAFRQAQPATPR